MRSGIRVHGGPAVRLALIGALATFGPSSVSVAQDPPPEKAEAGFGEARLGDVPEGTAEMMNAQTDRAISTGLAWLAKSQNPDGSFGNGTYRGNIAVTSLAGLAFMAAGSSPGRGPFGTHVDKALNYVMENTAPSGFIAVSSAATHGPMYSHGFGALFLAEAYGMTHRPEIREKLQKAIRLIIDTQNKEGGWRYQPAPRDADLSVTICQINALRAARNAGLYVPKETVEACIRYVKLSQNPDGGFAICSRGGQRVPPLGGRAWSPSTARRVRLQGDRVGDRLPEAIHARDQARQPLQPLFLRPLLRGAGDVDSRGQGLDVWYPAIRDELLRRQATPGFWADSICNEYGTAMALIILQMPNNYLPIFQR
jgi:hypothetical protein